VQRRRGAYADVSAATVLGLFLSSDRRSGAELMEKLRLDALENPTRVVKWRRPRPCYRVPERIYYSAYDRVCIQLARFNVGMRNLREKQQRKVRKWRRPWRRTWWTWRTRKLDVSKLTPWLVPIIIGVRNMLAILELSRRRQELKTGVTGPPS
jgi:hypothetical protein